MQNLESDGTWGVRKKPSLCGKSIFYHYHFNPFQVSIFALVFFERCSEKNVHSVCLGARAGLVCVVHIQRAAATVASWMITMMKEELTLLCMCSPLVKRSENYQYKYKVTRYCM